MQLILGLLFSLCFVSVRPFGLRHPRAVNYLDIDAFMGRWYQTHSSAISLKTFQKNAYCVTVDYVNEGDNRFKVWTSQNLDSPSGRVKKTNSTAIVPDPENAPAKFDVTVADQTNTTLHAWVIMTGPIDDQTGLYKYYVMSDSLGVDLFIFTRNVTEFQATDQSQVLVEVGAKGFIFPFNRPHRSYQGLDCVYPPLLSTDSDSDTADS